MTKSERLAYLMQYGLVDDLLGLSSDMMKTAQNKCGLQDQMPRLEEIVADMRKKYVHEHKIESINERLNIDDLYEMESLPVWVIPKDADIRTNRRIGYYLISVDDETLINGKGLSYDFEDVVNGNISVFRYSTDIIR